MKASELLSSKCLLDPQIAIEGCAHGELDIIYETLQYIEAREKFKFDLLICCGDFQVCRIIQNIFGSLLQKTCTY
jgi:hypothetical protein